MEHSWVWSTGAAFSSCPEKLISYILFEQFSFYQQIFTGPKDKQRSQVDGDWTHHNQFFYVNNFSSLFSKFDCQFIGCNLLSHILLPEPKFTPSIIAEYSCTLYMLTQNSFLRDCSLLQKVSEKNYLKCLKVTK